ncbi:MAG: hypothetical protein RLZZ387_4098 [Chloroflexota bacterium]
MRFRLPRSFLALSTVDLALVVVMAALLKAHLIAAIEGSLVALLFAVQHAMIIVFTFTHQPTRTLKRPRYEVALAWAGTLLPLTLRPGGTALIAEAWVLVAAGSVLATTAILSLGRSFGMEPAHRGLQVGGLYRFVRHPIYAAYLLIVIGFLLMAFSWWNSLVALGWFSVQVLRIRQEEQLLSADPNYRTYEKTVRYRIIPGVW